MEPRRERLTRERVLRAAMARADRDGIEGLSMRSVADDLGVKAMSLYNHVRNKEDVLDGLVDFVAAEFVPPRVGNDWRGEMRSRAFSMHEALLRHPWATMPLVNRVNTGPAMLTHVNATIGCLLTAGFSYAEADHAWNAIDGFVYGFSLQKFSFPFPDEQYAAQAASYLPHLPDTLSWLRGMTEEVATGRYDGRQNIAFGLDLILDGLVRSRQGA